jgi:hypothetical protein
LAAAIPYLLEARYGVYFRPVSTLSEIEAAAEKLPVPQLEALVESLNARLQRERAVRTPKNDLAEFSGVLRLTEDPLTWQQRVRGEWE